MFITVLMPSDEYLYDDKGYNNEQNFANDFYAYGQNQSAYLTILRTVPMFIWKETTQEISFIPVFMFINKWACEENISTGSYTMESDYETRIYFL